MTPSFPFWESHRNTKIHNHKAYTMNLAQPHTGSVFVTLVFLSLYELFQILVLAFMWKKKHKQQYKIFLSPGLSSQLKIFFCCCCCFDNAGGWVQSCDYACACCLKRRLRAKLLMLIFSLIILNFHEFCTVEVCILYLYSTL